MSINGNMISSNLIFIFQKIVIKINFVLFSIIMIYSFLLSFGYYFFILSLFKTSKPLVVFTDVQLKIDELISKLEKNDFSYSKIYYQKHGFILARLKKIFTDPHHPGSKYRVVFKIKNTTIDCFIFYDRTIKYLFFLFINMIIIEAFTMVNNWHSLITFSLIYIAISSLYFVCTISIEKKKVKGFVNRINNIFGK